MTVAQDLILDAVRARVLLLATDAGLVAQLLDGEVPRETLSRLRQHRSEVLAQLPPEANPYNARQPATPRSDPDNPYRRSAVEGGAPQAVLDTLADAWQQHPEDAAEHRSIWEEQTGKSIFGPTPDFTEDGLPQTHPEQFTPTDRNAKLY